MFRYICSITLLIAAISTLTAAETHRIDRRTLSRGEGSRSNSDFDQNSSTSINTRSARTNISYYGSYTTDAAQFYYYNQYYSREESCADYIAHEYCSAHRKQKSSSSYIWVYILVGTLVLTVVICCRNNIMKFCCCCCKRFSDDEDSDDDNLRGHKKEQEKTKDNSHDWYGDDNGSKTT